MSLTALHPTVHWIDLRRYRANGDLPNGYSERGQKAGSSSKSSPVKKNATSDGNAHAESTLSSERRCVKRHCATGGKTATISQGTMARETNRYIGRRFKSDTCSPRI